MAARQRRTPEAQAEGREGQIWIASAAGAVARLVGLGVPEFLVRGVLGQELVSVACPSSWRSEVWRLRGDGGGRAAGGGGDGGVSQTGVKWRTLAP